jgi:hypothetical protein
MSSRERTMLIVLGGVVVVAAAVFLLTRGGGEPQEAAPTIPTPPPVAPPAEPTPRPPRIPVFFAARDPFVPLVIEATAAPTDGGTTAPDGDDGDDGAPVDGAPVNGDPVEPPTGDGEQPGVTIGGHSVVVIDVFTRNGEEVVQVSVDGQTHVVGEGDRFAGNFEVVSIQGECATFLFGDETFTACEGGRPK